MPRDPERHYNINKLNALFALAAIILLISLIGMFAHDYSRDWKNFQKRFRALELQKTKGQYAEEVKDLNQKQEYKDLLKKEEEAQKKVVAKSAEIAAIEKNVAKIRARYDLLNQKSQFTKAEYGVLRYDYEDALSKRDPRGPALKNKLNKLDKEMAGYRLDLENTNAEITRETNKIQAFEEDLENLGKEQKKFTKLRDILERKLKKIDPQRMTVASKVANTIRDLPVLDLANPNDHIQQIVLKDLTDSVNFMQVPKVDRCITCHLGIDNPDYKDAPQPFTTHPRLELFVANNSKHPMEEFGCTTCHGGRGRGTDFVTAVHTPSSKEQEEDWKKKYHWREYHLWEQPMYHKQYIEAGCLKCHSGETVIKGAEKLNLGLNLIERAGCFGCHTMEKYKDWPKTGPDLTHLASKAPKEWVYRWIESPQSFRHNTWMPEFFHQSNNSDHESQKRVEQEIHAMVAYLFKNSTEYKMDQPTVNGDVQRGEELVSSIGCFACHTIQPEKTQEKITRDKLKREQGPNLIGLGTKTSLNWLTSWLKDPNRYHPGTKMPNLRLSDQEAADIAVYLSTYQNQNFMKGDLPAVDEGILTKITENFLRKSMTVQEAKDQAAPMKLEDKLQFTGKKLIQHYGCFACHNIKGFENEKPIGTELTEEGSKPAEKLDFGFIDIDHTNDAWFVQKLKSPRVFDQGKVKAPEEKLKMPNFHFTDEEVDAIVTVLLGMVKDPPALSKMPARTPKNLYVAEGQKIIRQFNCQGCHIIEGEGGAIQPAIEEWLVKYGGKTQSDAHSFVGSFSPPNLVGEGQKVQAAWLFDFLHQPTTIRPWLKVRMPTYNFDEVHLNTLVKYFNYLDDQDFPFVQNTGTEMTPEEKQAAEKLISKDYFGCATCHIVGAQLPGGSPDSWAPDLALAHSRLKPSWIIEWMKDPQKLLPGTKMPTYFDPATFDSSGPDDLLDGDEMKQIKALRNYILSLSSEQATPRLSTEATEPPTQK